jgi:lipopolysaccharide/colanic/teichoic acid biosynthesis glycosyltransferase
VPPSRHSKPLQPRGTECAPPSARAVSEAEMAHRRKREMRRNTRAHTDTCCPADVRGKDLVDRFVALVGLILSAPFIAFLVGIVRLTSRGPGLYSQTRLGLDGKPFCLYKIRTLHHGCDRAQGPVWTRTNDHRASRLGHLLRATHLDELPQLVNVLKGEMSLVGPRPMRPEITDAVAQRVPGFRRRLCVKPGITGLAQLYQSTDWGIADVRRKLRYDLFYAQHASMCFDLKIAMATVFRLLGIRVRRSRTRRVNPNATLVSQGGFLRWVDVEEPQQDHSRPGQAAWEVT